MLARILNEVFDKPVAGYEELLNGLIKVLDVKDAKNGLQSDKLDDLIPYITTDDSSSKFWTV